MGRERNSRNCSQYSAPGKLVFPLLAQPHWVLLASMVELDVLPLAPAVPFAEEEAPLGQVEVRL